MTTETIQSKQRLCELLPDYTDQVIKDLEWIVQKLGEVSIGSQAHNDYLQEARENVERLREEGHSEEYIHHHTPSQLLETASLAA